MRRFVVSALIAILLNSLCAIAQVPASAPQPPPGQDVQANQAAPQTELVVLPNTYHEGKLATPIQIGDSITIRATGDWDTKVEGVLRDPKASHALTLYLNNVPMSKLNAITSRRQGEAGIFITFDLTRDAQDDDNRKAWDSLLKKQHTHPFGFTSSLDVALAVGNDLPVNLKDRVEFAIASDERIEAIVLILLIVFLAVGYLLITHKNALRDKETGYYSLGKSQMAFWGLVVLLSFVGVWGATGAMERIPEQTLILLGISGATGLGAIVIGNSEKSKLQGDLETLRQKQLELDTKRTAAGANVPQAIVDQLDATTREIGGIEAKLTPMQIDRKPADLLTDICCDGNGLSFHRLQAVLWTVVLGAIFVSNVLQMISMPEFPTTLLTLMGISNATYLGFKIPEKTQ